ncbi:GNAT family N-acetyltransferase [Pseudonocardia nematodicida]|uniref:GNAT family N-acetyltransferase n=1 Tax=Pseudonocardia nematodicida TaxID=1206997 RepID=A0ABV1KH50_9PSEU
MIRERTPDDLDACVRALAQVHTADAYPMVWPDDPEAFLAPADLRAAWVAELDGAVVGHVALTDGPGEIAGVRPDALVSRLFVAPAGRGGGVGVRLLDHARRHAVSPMLQVESESGGAAIALYERHGWTRVADGIAHWTTPDGGPVTVRWYRAPAR